MIHSKLLIDMLKLNAQNNLFSEKHDYIKHEKSGCSPWNDLHSLRSDGTADSNNCKVWCNKNSNCGGFTVNLRNMCYFKNEDCRNDIRIKANVVLYLKQGSHVLIMFSSCFQLMLCVTTLLDHAINF